MSDPHAPDRHLGPRILDPDFDLEPAPPLALETDPRPRPAGVAEAAHPRVGAASHVPVSEWRGSSAPFTGSGTGHFHAPPPAEARPTSGSPLTVLPFGVWKRVAAYSLLFGVLMTGCTCRGLSPLALVSVVALIIVGVAGAIATYDQRSA